MANVLEGLIDTSDVLKMPFTDAEYVRYRLEPGDVLLNEGQSRDLVGRSAVYRGDPPDCCFQNTIIRFRAGAEADAGFAHQLFTWLRLEGRFAEIATQTTSIAHLGIARFGEFQVEVPALQEQREIAATLKAVDDAIAAGEALVEQLDLVWRSLVRHLMTQGVNERREVRSTPVGDAPVGWAEASIGDIATDIAYGTSLKLDGDPGATPVLRIPNVVSGVVDVDLKYASLPDRDLESLRLVADDLLLVRTNGNPSYVGRSLLFPGREGTWAFASYLIRVRVDRNQVLPAFLHYALQAPGVRRSIERGIRTSAGNYNLNTQGIRATRFNLPPISEQQAIVDALRVVEVRAEKERAVLAERRRLKAAFADALLTGRIRVPVPNGV